VDPVSTSPGVPVLRILAAALVGTALTTAIVAYSLATTAGQDGWILHAGPGNAAHPLLERDFPEEPVTERGSHDGAYFYAVADDPLHLWDPQGPARYLDRPAYRLQRPFFPLLAWVFHPFGSGTGLAWTMFAVGVAALVLGGWSAGALSWTLGGPVWPAVLFPLLPGAVMSLRITVADVLATGLALAAVVALRRGPFAVAVALGVTAVFTKEPVWLILAGVAIPERHQLRRALLFAGVPAAAAGAWALWLTARVPAGEGSAVDFRVPFAGFADSVRYWATGESPLALLTVTAAVGLGAAALIRRRPRHPLWWAVALNMAFLFCLSDTSVALDRNGTRIALPLLAVALIAVVAPGRDPVPGRDAPSPHGDGSGPGRLSFWPRPVVPAPPELAVVEDPR
jgi:hypothetical protein